MLWKYGQSLQKIMMKKMINKAYSIRYEAIPIEFPIYLNTVNNTISSFEFKKINDDEDDKQLIKILMLRNTNTYFKLVINNT